MNRTAQTYRCPFPSYQNTAMPRLIVQRPGLVEENGVRDGTMKRYRQSRKKTTSTSAQRLLRPNAIEHRMSIWQHKILDVGLSKASRLGVRLYFPQLAAIIIIITIVPLIVCTKQRHEQSGKSKCWAIVATSVSFQ